MIQTIFLFGEAEKGDFCFPYCFKTLEELCCTLGQPPEESLGIHFAIQALLMNKPCTFFRVKEEGYSLEDYLRGLHLLESDLEKLPFFAIGLPGVGDPKLIEITALLCQKKKSSLIITEQDLYDYLTG